MDSPYNDRAAKRMLSYLRSQELRRQVRCFHALHSISLGAFIISTLPNEMLIWLFSPSLYESVAVWGFLADVPESVCVYWNGCMWNYQVPVAFQQMTNNPDSLTVNFFIRDKPCIMYQSNRGSSCIASFQSDCVITGLTLRELLYWYTFG